MRIEINLNDITKSNEEKKLQEQTNGAVENNQSGLSGSKTEALKYGAVAALGLQAIEEIGNKVISTEINKIGSRYGDQARENKIKNKISMLDRGASMGKNILIGAVAGPVGIAVALIGTAASEVYDMVETKKQWTLDQSEIALDSSKSLQALGLTATDLNR